MVKTHPIQKVHILTVFFTPLKNKYIKKTVFHLIFWCTLSLMFSIWGTIIVLEMTKQIIRHAEKEQVGGKGFGPLAARSRLGWEQTHRRHQVLTATLL